MRIECGFADTENATGQASLVHVGPTLHVDIGFDPEYAPGKNIIPAASIPVFWSSSTPVRPKATSTSRQLRPWIFRFVEQRSYGAATGLHPANMYLAQIRVPALNYTVWGEFTGAKSRWRRAHTQSLDRADVPAKLQHAVLGSGRRRDAELTLVDREMFEEFE